MGGIGLVFGPFWLRDWFSLSSWGVVTCAVLGFLWVQVGAMSSKAQWPKLRVFGQLDWRWAKATYRDDAPPTGGTKPTP
uniref:Uncharacterized protein n=1 Tax=Ralstonia syzygii R24 TaxID=907261 RepID=G3A7U9_9RALS|nr:hypothetical protein RALSY_40813 [Ralstonia syzygii R24]